MDERIALLPERPAWAVDALSAAGVQPVEPDATTTGLIWLGFHDPAGLVRALRRLPNVRWVQLPSAGAEDFLATEIDPAITWTSAKGAYAEPVAEHALTLLLAGLRQIHRRARAATWGAQAGTSLYGRKVLVIGAGGVAQELIRLLAPFRCEITVVRRRAVALPSAARTITPDAMHEVLPGADAVVVAAALTAETSSLIDAPALAAMAPGSVLVNIARGGLVDLAALTDLPLGVGPGAVMLDVTTPEPLPDGHPLWHDERVLITPHTADTWEMIRPLLARRIEVNARAFARGTDLVGEIDLDRGY